MPTVTRVLFFLLASVGIASADMVLSDSIHNDPAKEKLCEARAIAERRMAKVVPLFYIDDGYVANVRSHDPGATFIVIEQPQSPPEPVECYLIGAKYQPLFGIPQWAWHPLKQITRYGTTRAGLNEATSICNKAAASQNYRPNFVSASSWGPGREMIGQTKPPGAKPRDEPGVQVGGKTVELYDILVKGQALYGPANPDLLAVNYSCLLSNLLELKAFEFQQKR
jgi:hypothetical protein